jgi:group I intron endonuclease
MIVYKITNKINNKVYIGQTTTSLSARWTQHCSKSSNCRKLSNAIKKYGKENFKIEIVKKCNNINELNIEEEILIKKENSVNCGYNLSSGGLNKKHSKESKLKMSKPGAKNPMYGQSRSDLTKYNKAQKGKKWEERFGKEKAKIAKAKKGNATKKLWKDPEYREKNSNLIKKTKLKKQEKTFNVYKAICVQSSNKGRKAIYKKGEFVGSWENKSTCAEDLSINSKNLSCCLNGKYKQMYGYIFIYKSKDL